MLIKIPIITTTMKIVEVNLEVKDHIDVKILANLSEFTIPVVEANVTKIHVKANMKVTIIKAITTKIIFVSTTTHVEAIIRVIIMANLEVEARAMVEVVTMDVVTEGLNYQGNDNYQYHQYYGHDNDYQPEQYGPPRALCSGYNHSPKHCFNNIMEKINISGHQSQQSGLYQ